MDKKLFAEFTNPSSVYRGKPFWAWNGLLDPKELRRQVRVMHKMGLGGFFMHSRVGLTTEYLSEEWFECVRACVDEAKKLGMEAWLYDEDRWPSGAAGGLVTKNPKHRQRFLMMEQLDNAGQLKWDVDVLAAFTARVVDEQAFNVKRIKRGSQLQLTKKESILVFRVMVAPPHDNYNGAAYLDTLSHEAVKKFIQVTHEAYKREIGEHFGQSVPGIFTDEPLYGVMMTSAYTAWLGYSKKEGIHIPWTKRLPTAFKKRYGYDIIDHLPEIFLDVEGLKVTPARYDYHDCVTYLFVDAFARQIGQWCDKNNMIHTGHVMMEDTLSKQTAATGGCMRFYEHMQAPGMDNLTEYNRLYDTAKQVSSAARQFGRKWRLSETYGGTGWDFPFTGHKALGDWQAALGINLRCQHLCLYTMEGEAKRDWPPSIFYQSPWREVYSKVEDYFARIHVAMTRGEEVRDLLVIHPIESMWMLCKKGWTESTSTIWKFSPTVERYNLMLQGLSDSLLAANIDFDYGDEDILSRHAKVKRNRGEATLVVGKASYKTVLVPPLLTIRSSTLKLLKRFKANGGTVVFADKVAHYVDARASQAASELAAKCSKAPSKGIGLVRAVESSCRRISIADADGNEIIPALHLIRESRDTFYLFVCNTGHDFRRGKRDKSQLEDIPVSKRTMSFDDVRIRGFAGCQGRPIELDADNGEVYMATARNCEAGWEICTSLGELNSRLFVIPKRDVKNLAAPRKTLRNIRTIRLNPGAWKYLLSECNNLVLDRPRYRIGSGAWHRAEEILRVDMAVRDTLKIPHRGGMMVQPWAKKKSAKCRTVTLQLKYNFDVKCVPKGDIFLGIERPDLYRISVNGTSVDTNAECGWWVDKSLRRVPIDPSLFRQGSNKIVLNCDYDEYHPGLEVIHLLGSFGTEVHGTNVVITKLPEKLKLGNWVKQGLAFYSGAVSYLKTIRPRLRGGQRLFVEVPKYSGTCVRVLVNGKSAGVIAWEPNEIDITNCVDEGTTELVIQVFAHRRNSHGPLHQAVEGAAQIMKGWVGPQAFVTRGDGWTDAYDLVACGLMESPRLIVRQ